LELGIYLSIKRCGLWPPNLTYRNFKVMNVHHSIFELHLMRIAKFAFGVRQFIAAFNDGIYSVPSKCREINFTKQGGNQSTLKSYARHSKLPHSKERCHARKSKIHSNIFEITFPFEVGTSKFSLFTSLFVIRLFVIRLFIQSCGASPPNLKGRQG
jgi:hypothetical protein